MTAFRDQMERGQLAWRAKRLPQISGRGWWQKKQYDHILPAHARDESLWPGIRTGGVRSLADYLDQLGIQAHKGRDNLLSSWTMGANLYFPFGSDDARHLVATFLADRTGLDIATVRAVELEYALGSPLDPGSLLGEQGGKRGANQTSPDVAFECDLRGGGRAVVLTEVKWTEHNFYPCSGYKSLDKAARQARCLNLAHVLTNPAVNCDHAATRERRYWDHLAAPMRGAPAGNRVRRCPAATSGYQLFRQQALAEALARSGDFAAVVSSVAYDARNTGLMRSLRTSGIPDIRTTWATLFDGEARFWVFTHQEWVAWVAAADSRPGWCDDWLLWVGDRYGVGSGGVP